MITHCIQQVMRGVTNLALASFILFTFFVHGPEGLRAKLTNDGTTFWYVLRSDHQYLLSPWPYSYLLWLFNPSNTEYFDTYSRETVSKGIDLQIGSIQIRGSGALIGDLGQAVSEPFAGSPVGHYVGSGVLELFMLISLIVGIAMAVAIAQRWRRRNVIYPMGEPESYLQAGHYFWFPPSYLVGWYQRAHKSGDRPTLRLY